MNDLEDVEEGISHVKALSTKMAEHFCENERSFSLDEFLETFKEFTENIKTCQQVRSYFFLIINVYFTLSILYWW